MSDLIDRQAAIDAFDEIESEIADGYGYQYAKWREYFAEIPSAQPEPSQVAKDIARILENGQDMRVIAQPERIKGRWEVASTGYSGFMRCSACKAGCCGDYRSMNFCPNCGAKMEVTE